MMSVFDWSELSGNKEDWAGREWFVVRKARTICGLVRALRFQVGIRFSCLHRPEIKQDPQVFDRDQRASETLTLGNSTTPVRKPSPSRGAPLGPGGQSFVPAGGGADVPGPDLGALREDGCGGGFGAASVDSHLGGGGED